MQEQISSTAYTCIDHYFNLGWVWFVLLLGSVFSWVGSVHCLRDPQGSLSKNITFKLSLTKLFIHLKFILLQYFHLAISDI